MGKSATDAGGVDGPARGVPERGGPARKAPRPLTQEQRRDRRDRRKNAQQKKNKNPLSKRVLGAGTWPSIPPFSIKTPRFAILPQGSFHPRIHFFLSFFTLSIQQRTQWMDGFRKKPFHASKQKNGWTPPSSKSAAALSKKIKPIDALWSITLNRRLSEAVETTVNLRYTFRKFLHHWRASRLKQANTEDPVLCDVPQFPIFVVDWISSTRYVFDASTILQDLDSRVLHCDGFFDEPLDPRNSFTNESFTLAQKISIWNQLLQFRKERSLQPLVSWAFSGYKLCSYSTAAFAKVYSITLKLHALRSTMADVNCWDSIDRLIDYIEYQHEIHKKPFSRGAYIHGVKRAPYTPILVQWRTLCLYYYESNIKFINDFAVMQSIQSDLEKQTLPLCERPVELMNLYREHLHLRTQEESDEVILNLQQYLIHSLPALSPSPPGGSGFEAILGTDLSTANYNAILQLLNLQTYQPIQIPQMLYAGHGGTAPGMEDGTNSILSIEPMWLDASGVYQSDEGEQAQEQSQSQDQSQDTLPPPPSP